jgi:hypothetical protein
MRGLRLTKDQYAAITAKAKALRSQKSKYHNKKKMIDGITFDSTKEARRYQDLMLMQKADQIAELRRQVPFRVEIRGQHICTWFADFTYFRKPYSLDARVVEDVKGVKTPEYRLKKRLVEALYSLTIVET